MSDHDQLRKELEVLRVYIREVCGGEDASKILKTAEIAHTGQTRRSGEPYIEHPIAVANIIKKYYPGDQLLCTAALLHDTLEDAIRYGNFKDEDELIDTIKASYHSPAEGKEVLTLLYMLTHTPGGDYTNYVVSLSDNIGALRIKMADMLHNLSSAPHAKQATKYQNALMALSDKFGGIPPGINISHWNDIQDIVSEFSD
jgi:GTP pyrophosphokinase